MRPDSIGKSIEYKYGTGYMMRRGVDIIKCVKLRSTRRLDLIIVIEEGLVSHTLNLPIMTCLYSMKK